MKELLQGLGWLLRLTLGVFILLFLARLGSAEPLPQIEPEFQIAIDIAAPDSNDSRPGRAGVAFDGTNYLVVSCRDIIEPYGLFGVLVSQDSVVLDTFFITQNECYTNPNVAFDGRNHLIVYSRPGQAYGVRVSSDGDVLDSPNGFLIGASSGDPKVSFNGENYLVVWNRFIDSGNHDIFGALINPSGDLLPNSPFPIFEGPGEQINPEVSFDGVNYFVVWRDTPTGSGPSADTDISGALISASGQILNTGIPITTAPSVQEYPAVSFAGSFFYVSWVDTRNDIDHDYPYTDVDIYGTRVTRDGVVLDGVQEGGGIAINEYEDYYVSKKIRPQVGFDGQNYFVVWELMPASYPYGPHPPGIYAARIAPDGVLIDGPPDYSPGILISYPPTTVSRLIFPNIFSAIESSLAVWTNNQEQFGQAKDVFGAIVSSSPPPAPAMPTLEASDGAYTDRIRVSWSQVENANTYWLYRSTNETDLGEAPYARLIGNSFDDINVQIDNTYYYAVEAIGDGGHSALSNIDSGILANQDGTNEPPADSPLPTASDGTDPNRVLVTWVEVTGATWYELYRSEFTSLHGNLLSSPSGLSYSDTTAVPGTRYYYRVLACNDYGCSAFGAYDEGYRSASDDGGGTLPTHGPAATASDGTFPDRIRVTWPAVSGATQYQLFRSEEATTLGIRLIAGAGLAYADTSAVAGRKYYYRLRACNDDGCTKFGAYDEGYRSAPDDGGGTLPTHGPAATASDGTFPDRVRVTWPAVSGATQYQLFRSEAATTLGIRLIAGAGLAYADTSAVAGRKYYYRLRACNDDGCTKFGAYDEGYRSAPDDGGGTLPTHGPAATASDGTFPDRIRVTWPAVSGATQYQLFRSEEATTLGIRLIAGAGLAYADTSAVAGRKYYYRLRACNDDGCTKFGAYDEGYRSAPDGGGGTLPTHGPAATASDGTFPDRVRVTWPAVSGATQYQLFRSEEATTLGIRLIAGAGLAYADTSAVAGRKYYYRLRACNDDGCTKFGAYDEGYRSAPDGGGGTLPTHGPAATASDGTFPDRVRVTWPAVSGATQYQLFRSEEATTLGIRLIAGAGLAYADTSAVAGRKYYYRLRACNDDGCTKFGAYDEGYR